MRMYKMCAGRNENFHLRKNTICVLRHIQSIYVCERIEISLIAGTFYRYRKMPKTYTKRIIKDFLTHMVPSFEFFIQRISVFFAISYSLSLSLFCSVCDLSVCEEGAFAIDLFVYLLMYVIFKCSTRERKKKKLTRSKSEHESSIFLRLSLENHSFSFSFILLIIIAWISKIGTTRTDCQNANIVSHLGNMGFGWASVVWLGFS